MMTYSPVRAIKQYIELYHLNGIADFFTEKRYVKPQMAVDTSPLLPPSVRGDRGGVLAMGTSPLQPNNDLLALRKHYAECKNCSFSTKRIKIVFGEGNQNTKAMVIGNPPNTEENMAGRPFIGKYGLKFADMMRAIGLERKDLYITLICKCRPIIDGSERVAGGDGDIAATAEVKKCRALLAQEIKAVNPKIILVMGQTAANMFFDRDESMDYYRDNQGLQYDNIPVYVTYNPSEVLAYPEQLRRPAWVDLQLFRDHLQRL